MMARPIIIGATACLLALGCTEPPEKEAHKQPGKDKPRIARLDDAPAPARRISVAPDQLPADQFDGRRITSLLNVPKRMNYGDFVWDDQNVPAGDLWIRVDLAAQIISVFRGGEEIGTAVIMYGGEGKPTPIGQFKVLWRGEKHRSSLYDAGMPYTLRLTGDGIAIHGASVEERTATNGCVSVPFEFARLLFDQARVGTPVTILRGA